MRTRLAAALTAAFAAHAPAADPPCPKCPDAVCPPAAPGERMVAKVFSVMDLVTPIPDCVAPPMPGTWAVTTTPVEPAAGSCRVAAPAVLATRWAAVPPPSPLMVRYMAYAVTPPPAAVPTPAPYVTLAADRLPQPAGEVRIEAALGTTLTTDRTPLPCPVAAPVKSAQTSDQLVKLVTTTVRPASWAGNGGRGTAEFYPTGGALVVNNTPDVVREVDGLLASLRKLQEASVVVECRLVSVPADLGATMTAGAVTVADNTCPTTFLSDADLVRHLTAVQACPRSNVVMLPKMTVFNGQTSHVTCEDKKTFTTGLDVRTVDHRVVAVPKQETVALGTTVQVRPVLSADGRFVDLALQVRLAEEAGSGELLPVTHPVTPVFEGGSLGVPVPFTTFIQQPNVARREVSVKAVVPAEGRTVAVRLGTKTVESRSEFGPPVVSQLPYVGRLFTNKAIMTEPHDVIALVTVRALPQAQAETPCVTAACCEAKPVSEAAGLVAAYRKACADGRTEEAMKLAMKALAADPACFAGATK